MSQEAKAYTKISPATDAKIAKFLRPKLLRLSGACLLFQKWSKSSGRYHFALVHGNDKIRWIVNLEMANAAFDLAAA